jgi:hypothetical protein
LLLLLRATLDELCRADEQDGSTELLLGAVLDELSVSLEELDSADELLLGTTLEELFASLEELGSMDELELGTDELYLTKALGL